MKPTHSLLLSFFFLAASVTMALAGGGAVTPLNFSYAQQITGKSFSPELSVKDPASNYTSPLSGKEFNISAEGTLPGAVCDTTQRISDGEGKIRANCRADAYGKFSFKVLELATGANYGTFEVYFTESGSGFSDQGSQGSYTVSLAQGSFTTTLFKTYKLEAILKKDGQVTSNYDEVNFFRWEVLEGSLVALSGQTDKNRIVEYRSAQEGKAVVRVVAVMNNGSTVESGAITITTINPPSPTPKPSTSPSATPTQAPGMATTKAINTGTPTSLPQPTSDSEQLKEEVENLKQQVEEQQKELNALQKIVQSLRDFISRLFGRE